LAVKYGSVGKSLRYIVCAFYVDGVIKEKPSKRYIKHELSKDRVELLRKIVRLLVMTDFSSEPTKLYLANPTYTYKHVADIISEKGIKINANQAKGKVWYDIRKLTGTIGDDAIDNILMYRHSDITMYENAINSKLSSLSDNILDNFALDLSTNLQVDKLSDYDFDDMVKLISPYSKRYRDLVARSVTDEMKEYLSFLIGNNASLNGIDLDRYNKLKELTK